MELHHDWIAATAWALTIGATQLKGAQLVGWRLRVTPPELTGRVFGAIRVAAVVGIAIGAYAGGVLASTSDGGELSSRLPRSTC